MYRADKRVTQEQYDNFISHMKAEFDVLGFSHSQSRF